MKKTMRVITMAGMGILAGLTISAAPAQASGTATQPAAKAPAGQSSQVQQHRGRDQVVGYYRSLRACEFAGRIGERFNKWDDYDCDFVRFGFRRGTWALEVSQDRWGHGHNNGPWGHNGPRGHQNGPWDRNDGPRGPQHHGPRR